MFINETTQHLAPQPQHLAIFLKNLHRIFSPSALSPKVEQILSPSALSPKEEKVVVIKVCNK